MSKAKFDAAQELINEKKYAEARSLLTTIDHPMAKEWISQIDAIIGGQPWSPGQATIPQSKPRRRSSPLSLLLALILFCSCGFILVTVVTQQGNVSTPQPAQKVIAQPTTGAASKVVATTKGPAATDAATS